MGDVIHALPAVASLKHSIPQSHVIWAIRPRWAPLLEGNPYVDEILPVPRSVWSSLDCTSRLRQQRIDVAVDFQGLIQTALFARASSPGKLVGFGRQHIREGPASWFYSSRVEIRAEHVVEQNLELAGAAGADRPLKVFPLPKGNPEGSLPESEFILVSPFAGWGSKQWPIARWTELASRLKYPLVVNGPPGTEHQLRAVQGAHVHVSGIGGLIHATRRAHAVIGLDSGPMHMAAAIGKPGVAIFGPTDPARNGPYGGSLQTLRIPEAITDYGRRAEPADSMSAITVSMVLDALSASLDFYTESSSAR